MPYSYYNNPYMNSGAYAPYYQNIQQQRLQDPYQLQFNRQSNLQGKVVDNIDVVKAIDIPLDGTISYFPFADGSAIVTRQLQQDGTSKLIVYKPDENGDAQKQNKYITENDLKQQFGDLTSKDIKDIKDEIKTLKKKIREMSEEYEDKGEG